MVARAGAIAALVADLGGAASSRPCARAGVWDTARRAWLAHGALATHHLVVQDDAVPCARFRERVLGAIAARPAHVVTLYTHRAREVAAARERGDAWAWGPDCAYGVASLMPVGLIVLHRVVLGPRAPGLPARRQPPGAVGARTGRGV